MLGFGKPRPSHDSTPSGSSTRYRVESRRSLLEKFEMVCLDADSGKRDDRQKLAGVLEELATDGWRLVGVSGDDFIFRRRR